MAVLLLCMIFCHIVDDYYFQGLLANLKQKSFWKMNAPDKMYKYDYIMALIMHSLSWSFMIMLPLLVHFNFDAPNLFFALYAANTVVHAIVDDLKANKRQINLITDQSIHIAQILATLLLLVK